MIWLITIIMFSHIIGFLYASIKTISFSAMVTGAASSTRVLVLALIDKN